MEIKKVVEEWEIWDEEEEATKSEEEAKRMVPEKCQARFTPGWKSTGWTRR